MSKIFQALLTGVFFTFILDFFLFLGIQQHYINFYAIDIYYNILFVDNQNIFIYSFVSIFIGYLVIYLNSNKLSAIVLGMMFFLVSLTLHHDIGNFIAKKILMKENVTIQWKTHTYNGDIYYNGRDVITFYDYELKKFILLNKKDIKQ